MKKLRKTIYLLILCMILIPLQTKATGVTLTWVTDTYTPLEYQGKALPTRGSNIEVAVQFNSPGTNPNNLIFNWFINNKIQKQSSGLGKQTLKFQLSEGLFEKHLIRVKINDKNGSLINESETILLEPNEPEVVIRVKNPFLVFSDKYQFADNQDIEFIATPYFFNITNINDLEYQWKLNTQEAPQIDSNNLYALTLKIDQVTKTITQRLSLWVENVYNRIQRAQSTVEITIIP